MSYQLGLDLGTTASAAAVNVGGAVSMLTVGHQSLVIPSVAHLGQDGSLLVGEPAERRAKGDPAGVAREFKRRFGDPQPLILNGSPVAANDLMVAMASRLVDEASAQMGGRPEGIVVCHPANWGEYKVSLLSDTLANSGLPPHRLLTEPVAAAIHGATQERIDVGSVIAVYDLGGGTFDVALLRKLVDGWELVGRPGGIERLGGIDFDAAILHQVLVSIGLDPSTLDESDQAAVVSMNRLREECRAAKHALSEDTATTVPAIFPGSSDSVRLTRVEFEALIAPAVSRTLEVFDTVVASADLGLEEIDRVLLVGGSTRIPLVHQRVLQHTGRPVTIDRHPKHAIALGAAASITAESATTVPASRPVPPVDAESPAPVEAPAPPGAAARVEDESASDMYRLPHISEAPLPEFLRRRVPEPGSTPRRPAHPDPVGAAAAALPTETVPPRTVPVPAVPSPAVPTTTVSAGAAPVIEGSASKAGVSPVAPRRGGKGFLLVVALVLALGGGAAALALADGGPRGGDGPTPPTDAPSTTEGAEAPPSTAAEPDEQTLVLGRACPASVRPDPAVTYRVSEIPDDEPEQSLNGRNIPSVRAIGEVESVPVTTFPEFSVLDLTYLDCVVDDRGRAWWGVHFDGGLVWSSTRFIEPVSP